MEFQRERNFKFFVDFDDTITKVDVGESIFVKFGGSGKINQILSDIDNSTITALEGWKQLFNEVPEFDLLELDNYINSVEIDLSFIDFVKFAADNNADVYILSDGFDYYIKRILSRYDINVKYFSNKLYFDGAKPKTIYDFQDEECRDCAHCKRNRILDLSSDEDYTVYVGNGHSDKCASQYCDFIFAKDSLLKFCNKERISFSPFNSFKDVIEKMEKVFEKKRIKKRHQAELNRRAVYMQG